MDSMGSVAAILVGVVLICAVMGSVGSLGAILMGIVLTCAVIALRVRSAGKRTARLVAQWESLLHQRATSGGHLIQVIRVYQQARRGSKAEIRWYESGLVQDAWFWNWHVPPGAYLLVTAQSGYGPHNDNPNVLYVYLEQVHAWVPGAAALAAQRMRT